MKPVYVLVMSFLCTTQVQAEIYKSVDADGHVTYSSAPIKGGKKIFLEPLPTMVPPSRTRSSDSSEGFPKVDNATQEDRDETRRKILQDELSMEEKLLDDARQKLKEGEENPEVYRGKGGKTYRNMAKYEEKIKNLKNQVDMHSKNVEALEIELSKNK